MEEYRRTRKFLNDLDDLVMDNCYYDDENGTEVIEVTEEDCYDALMQTDEYHLLGSEKVRAFIHIFLTDWVLASEIRHAFKLY